MRPRHGLQLLTWNVERVGHNKLGALLEEVDGATKFEIFSMQDIAMENPDIKEAMQREDYDDRTAVWNNAAPFDTAIIIRKDNATQINIQHIIEDRYTVIVCFLLDAETYIAANDHLPSTWQEHEKYQKAILKLADSIKHICKPTDKITTGGDRNAEPPMNHRGDSNHEMNEREVMVSELMAAFNLAPAQEPRAEERRSTRNPLEARRTRRSPLRLDGEHCDGEKRGAPAASALPQRPRASPHDVVGQVLRSHHDLRCAHAHNTKTDTNARGRLATHTTLGDMDSEYYRPGAKTATTKLLRRRGRHSAPRKAKARDAAPGP